MKKFALLTSVLALAACGGGAGGPGAVDSTRVSASAIASNAKITGMASEIVIGENGAATARAATQPGQFSEGGKNYNVYKLDDVELVIGDESFGMELKFGLAPDGTVNTLYVLDEDPDGHHTLVFNRDGQSNNFKGKINDGNAIADGTLQYVSLGKDLGLRYSDFGYLPASAINKWRATFAGGYDVMRIKDKDMQKLDGEMTFNGRAVGGVVATNVNGQHNIGKSIDLLDKNATLTFNKGKQELTANFDNWYNIKYTKDGSEHGTISFDKYTGTDDTFRFADTQYASVTGEDFRYFGENGTPSEATGVLQAKGDGEFGVADEIRMNLSFGGTRK